MNALPVRLLGQILLLFSVVALLLSCAAGPQSPEQALAAGACPGFIIYPQGRSEAAVERYSDATTAAAVAVYRDRELANCDAQLAAGNAAALDVLLEYWYSQNNLSEVAAAYQVYVAQGTDQRALATANGALYALYSQDQPGLPADSEQAFYHLAEARRYDPAGYQLMYADALYQRALYSDAHGIYTALLSAATATPLPQAERCEVQLKLADLYFRGRGVQENWYIGYFYWLQGLALAADPAWGSCERHSYYDHPRYAYESQRKKAIDRRIAALGAGDQRRVQIAAQDAAQGFSTVASWDFRRPLLRSSAPSVAPGVAAPQRHWPAWRPLDGPLCQHNASNQRLSWSAVFQRRAAAIWTVQSRGDAQQTQGSAVAVAGDTLVTNCHFIQQPEQLLLLQDGRTVAGRVVAADRAGDRCIVTAADLLPTFVTAARPTSNLLVGEDVAAIGNPKGLNASLSRGLVAQKRDQNGRALIQTDAAISAGSSGGGLFDAAGNLVGITMFKVASGESLNFALAIDEYCR